ncbi:MAG: hypothetical protein V1870_05460 [Candidatus Aenigmatarchaeota archaeon]
MTDPYSVACSVWENITRLYIGLDHHLAQRTTEFSDSNDYCLFGGAKIIYFIDDFTLPDIGPFTHVANECFRNKFRANFLV